MMITTILHLTSAFGVTAISLLALKPLAAKIGLVDIPGGRKTHVHATPLVGGLGIFIGILTLSIVTPGVLSQFGPLLSLAALVLFIGTIDDARELSVAARMTGHVLVAIVMAVVAGVQLNSLGNLFHVGAISLGVLSVPFTVFATVGVINAINMSDGIDGLSGGLVVVALGFIAAMALAAGLNGTASFITLTICSILAFLTLNFRRPWNRKALVYLGDAGSTMLGFMLAWLLIDATQGETALFPPAIALWFLTIPLYDTVNLLIRRPLNGLSPFTPGNDHLHHNLIERGFSVEQTVAILLVVAILFGGIGVTGHLYGVDEGLMFSVFLAGFIGYFLVAEKIKPSTTAVHNY